MSKIDDEFYESLSYGESNLVGWCAYLSYLDDKKEWIEIFRNNNGRQPTEKDLKLFYTKARNNKKKYKEKGEQLKQWTINEEYRKELDAQKASCYNDIKSQVSDALKEQPEPPRMKGFGLNLLSSFLGSVGLAIFPFLLIGLFYLIAPNFTKDFLEYIKTDTRITDVKEVIDNRQNNREQYAKDKTVDPYNSDTVTPVINRSNP